MIKNMDLDDELDDYDGGEDYLDDGGDTGLSPLCRISCLMLDEC
jgi:hypothetical protein